MGSPAQNMIPDPFINYKWTAGRRKIDEEKHSFGSGIDFSPIHPFIEYWLQDQTIHPWVFVWMNLQKPIRNSVAVTQVQKDKITR